MPSNDQVSIVDPVIPLPADHYQYMQKKNNNLIFHPLEVVSRYRDPLLQVGENLNYLNQQDKGKYTHKIG